MTLVTGTVQDLGHDGMEGTLWARPARFRSDGQVVLAPERKPYKITGGVVSAELAPGPAVLELQVGSHARGTFEVVIPDTDISLADLLDTVFPWEPAQVSLFVAEREAAEQAATLAGTAKTGAELAAQQTGQDRTAVAADKNTVVAHVQALAEPNDAAVLGLISEGADTQTKAALNATYRSRLQAIPSSSMPTTPTPMPTVSTFSPAGPTSIQTTTDWTWTALDANAKIRFTAPPSGKVVVRMSGAGQDLYASSGLQWAIMGSYPTGVPEPASEAIVIAANTIATQHTRLEHTFTLNGLEPGKRYEYWWAHRCSNVDKFAHTNAGGVYGPAVISVTPVSDRITETGLDAVVAPSNYSPLWMSGDRTTFYATDYGKPDTGGRLGWSTDDGQTWHDTDHVFYSIQGVRECEDGEILVFTGDLGVGHSNCAVWRSSGWQANHKTATFTRTHQALMKGQSWAGWSISKHGPVIVAAEYGTKASPTDMARYAYLSEDDGRTWRPIFDLADPAHSTGIGAHMHGVCYDPWWDAIWIAVGDGPGNKGIFVSWDRGNTWKNLNHEHQMTSVYALPDRIMFITDEAPNGIWAIMRTTPGQLRFEKVFAADNDPTNLTVLGSSIFQAQSMPGAPIVVAVMSGVPGPGRLWASYDGQVWVELWKDNVNAVNHGLTYVAGPSLTGKYLAALNRAGDLKLKVTFSPPA